MKNQVFRAALAFTVALAAAAPAAAQEAPALQFKRLPRNGTLVLRNCPLIAGISAFQVTDRGAGIQPLARFRRASFDLGSKYRFFACQTEGDVTSLYVKATATSPQIGFTFTDTNFPDAPRNSTGIGQACPGGTKKISFGVLFKPSSDVSDARGGKPVVLLQGSSKTRSSALRIFATDGTEVCRFTFKAPDTSGINGGADHYYSGWNGGCAKTGSQIAAAARSASGDSNVYVEGKNGQCVGPVSPTARSGAIGG